MSTIIPVLLSCGFGVAVGALTGLIPGIHVNVVAALLAALAVTPYFFTIDPVLLAVFIAAVAIAHTFFDYIPTVFLGVPGEGALALLPGQKLVRQGLGVRALRLSLIGSAFGLLVGVAVAASSIVLAEQFGLRLFGELDRGLRPYLLSLLLGISVLLVVTDRPVGWSATVFLVSGLLGVVALGSPLVPNGDGAPFSAIFPALTGLFGVGGILVSLHDKSGALPKQEPAPQLAATRTDVGVAGGAGAVAGMAVGLLPGLGGANAATLLYLVPGIGQRRDPSAADHRYVITTSAIGAAEAVFAIVALYLIGKSRSGASVAIAAIVDSPITWGATSLVILAMLASGAVSFALLWRAGARLASLVARADYRGLGIATVGFIAALSIMTTGIWGGVILVAATAIGLIPHFTGVRKAQAMGFFLVPTMLFFSSRQAEVVDALRLAAVLGPDHAFTLLEVGLVLLLALGTAGCVLPVWLVLRRWTLHARIAATLVVAFVFSAVVRLGTVDVWLSAPGPDLSEPVLTVAAVGKGALDAVTFEARTERERLLTIRLDSVEAVRDNAAEHATAKLDSLVREKALQVAIKGRDRDGAFVAEVHGSTAAMICPATARNSGSIGACLTEAGVTSVTPSRPGVVPAASEDIDREDAESLTPGQLSSASPPRADRPSTTDR